LNYVSNASGPAGAPGPSSAVPSCPAPSGAPLGGPAPSGAEASGAGTAGAAHPECIFCVAADSEQSALVLHRGGTAFVILNLYPYNNGHVMVVPRRHIASLVDASPAELSELITLTRLSEVVLREAYAPHGLNVGINLGKAAGAGVADHMHIHVVPRWNGDTNFMTVVGEMRVLPETLDQTAARLRPLFARAIVAVTIAPVSAAPSKPSTP
jgi:ATP adenylyltransferase